MKGSGQGAWEVVSNAAELDLYNENEDSASKAPCWHLTVEGGQVNFPFWEAVRAQSHGPPLPTAGPSPLLVPHYVWGTCPAERSSQWRLLG
jgi:hypothetical protein